MSNSHTVSAVVADVLADVLAEAKADHDYLLATDGHYPADCSLCMTLMRATAVLRENTGHGGQYTKFSQHPQYPYNEWATQIDTDEAAANTQNEPFDYDEWVRWRMLKQQNSDRARRKSRL